MSVIKIRNEQPIQMTEELEFVIKVSELYKITDENSSIMKQYMSIEQMTERHYNGKITVIQMRKRGYKTKNVLYKTTDECEWGRQCDGYVVWSCDLPHLQQQQHLCRLLHQTTP